MVLARPPERALEPEQLQLDLDHEPVLVLHVEAGQVLDAAQALAQGVRVDEEGLGGRGDIAPPLQILLERGQKLGAVAAVIGLELRQRVAAVVAGAAVLGHAQQVLVGAEVVEADDAGLNKDHPLAIGLSQRCEGAAGSRTGFEEAEHAVTAAAIVSSTPDVVGFDDLGAYKYLLRVSQDGRTRDPRGEALRKLDEYDRRHRSQLLLTLEEYLKRRGNIAQAAQTLYVHPNTLRQRLRRIHDLTGLDVQHEDWLMVEIELKLLRLEHVLGQPPR